MALVVTAPSPLEAQTSLVTTTVSCPRHTTLLRLVALAGATWFGVSLVAEGIARFAQPWGSLDGLAQVTAITAMGAVATGGVRVLNDQIVRDLRIPDSVIDRVAAEEGEELAGGRNG